ncbi:MAG: hypothetical protein D5S00_08310 [Tindallia sp. MSAO_Bac2]|nr:MAG: hypothetical protein D5S00_08310 [Tindallia sp. MSAO_Bac2]
MSLFIGPIHHWLFNKIKIAEEIEKEILDFAQRKNLIASEVLEDAKQKFEPPTPDAPLESQIDHGNIHAWLQHRIVQVETRIAYFVTEILKSDSSVKKDIVGIYSQNATKIASSLSEVPSTPEKMVQSIHNYLLEGMPCDRAQRIVEESEDKVAWVYEPCLHKQYWDAVNGDVNHYYDFRKSWIQSFVYHLKPAWGYTLSSQGIHQIESEAK